MCLQWQEIQDRILNCDICQENARVACNIRQQTPEPKYPVKLLVVGIAPPYTKSPEDVAKSATNNPDDKVRQFIEETLDLPWAELIRRGLSFLHAVKCAIVPDKAGFQNPPRKVVDYCSIPYFSSEVRKILPERVITLGEAPFRAVIRAIEPKLPVGIRLSANIGDVVGEHKAFLWDHPFKWYVTYFPRAGQRKIAAKSILEAASESGLVEL